MPSRRWTAAERVFLRTAWYGDLAWRDLCRRLHRHGPSVRREAERLGLPVGPWKGRPRKRAPRDWTPEQDALLCDLWADPALQAAVIGASVGRSRSAVIGRAYRLHLGPKARAKIEEREAAIAACEAEQHARRAETQAAAASAPPAAAPLGRFRGQCATPDCRRTAQPGRDRCAGCNAARLAQARRAIS